MPFTWLPHELVVDPLTKVVSIAQRHDSICLMHGGQQFHIQHGQVFEEGAGAPLKRDDLPGWFWDQVRALTPLARQSCGFVLPEEELTSADQLPLDLVEQIRALPEHIRTQLLGQALGASRIDEKAPETSDEGSDTSLEPDSLTIDPEVSRKGTEVSRKGTEPPRPQTWPCPECQREVPLAHKGVHIARFTRNGKCS
jgi:hypothetical protein